jgi:hypothetical protein
MSTVSLLGRDHILRQFTGGWTIPCSMTVLVCSAREKPLAIDHA